MLSSCKKSHETPVKPKLSFSEATKTVKESDESIDITMTLDKPAPEAISITYELGGTAKDKVSAGTTSAFDYEITSSYLETKIKKGESTGTITVKLYSDFGLEDDETIEISIKSTDSDNIEITRDDIIKITVQQEDGLLIGLEWPAPTPTANADMDLILRVGANTSTWDGVLTGSAQGSFTGPEFIFIPKVADYLAYGLSYTYYDGTLDPLNFTVTFIDFANGAFEAQAQQQSFDATYTAANKNKWEDFNTTIVVQTFEKAGGAFTSPSVITVPDTLSRLASPAQLPSTLRKGSESLSTSKLIQSLLKGK
jgi:hypothetical protein